MKLWTSIVKDVKLSAQSFYTYILLVFAAAFVVTVVFLIPEEYSQDTTMYVHVGSGGTEVEDILNELEAEEIPIVDSRDEIIENMKKDRSSIGLDISMVNEKMIMEFITQGYESERLIHILQAHVMGGAAIEEGQKPNSMITKLESSQPDIPVSKGMLPVFLVMESALMGFFMVAAYVFQDKEEGTIKAYAVSPATIWQYLLSKTAVFILFGWISGLLVTISIMGPDIQYLQFILLLTAASAFGTVLGLIAAGLFGSFTKAMNVIFVVAFVLGITVVSYYMPSFSPIYIKILPTYPMMFAFREVLFPTGNPGLVYTNILGFSAASAGLFLVACRIYKGRLV